MKKFFIFTACVMIITGCNGLINQEKENNITPPLGVIDVTEIKVDSHVFSKDRNLTLLKNSTLTISKNPTEISVKAANVSGTAGIKVNSQDLVSFTNGEAKQTVRVSELTDVKIEIFDTAKQTLVYTFKIKVQEPIPPPPPLGAIDVTEIKVDSHVFSKDRNLTLLKNSTLTISKNPTEISVKAANVSGTASIKVNGQALVSFANGEAKQTVPVSGLTDLKIEIFDTAKETVTYEFKIQKMLPPANDGQQDNSTTQPPVEYNPAENDIPEIPVSSIKIVASDEIPVEPDGDTSFKITLTAGTDYTIKTEVLPAKAHNKELSYIFVDEDYKKYLRVSEQGVLTVLDKPQSSNPSWVRIESKSNPNVAVNLTVYIKPDSNPIIKNWSLTGDDVVPGAANNQIKVSGDKESTAHVKFTRGSTTTYKVDVIPSGSINIETISDGGNVGDVNEYKITINKNNTVWEKKSSIVFYKKEYNNQKHKWETTTLKTIGITQEGNRNFTKEIKWLEGVNPPAEGALKNIKPFDYAEWKEDGTTTWFGVRKVSYTTNGNYTDTKMCWAMTAANMLHWWFTQNENEITQYKQKHGITENSSNWLYYNNNYHRGHTEDESTKSSFASLLRLGFKDDGNPVRTALTWYLEGKDWGSGPHSIQDKTPPILFGDVFNSDNSIVTYSTLNNQNDVNTLFKKAIENKKAMAVSYELGGGNYPRGHVVTVWGISLDGAGNVFELWVADSDAGGHLKIPYLYNMGIHYSDDGRPKIVNLSTGKATHNQFSDITTLKLGKDKFN